MVDPIASRVSRKGFEGYEIVSSVVFSRCRKSCMFMNAGRFGSCHDQTCNKNQSEQFISYPCSFLALGPVGQPMKHRSETNQSREIKKYHAPTCPAPCPSFRVPFLESSLVLLSRSWNCKGRRMPCCARIYGLPTARAYSMLCSIWLIRSGLVR